MRTGFAHLPLHGGRAIQMPHGALDRSSVDYREKRGALKRLAEFTGGPGAGSRTLTS